MKRIVNIFEIYYIFLCIILIELYKNTLRIIRSMVKYKLQQFPEFHFLNVGIHLCFLGKYKFLTYFYFFPWVPFSLVFMFVVLVHMIPVHVFEDTDKRFSEVKSTFHTRHPKWILFWATTAWTSKRLVEIQWPGF